MKHSSLPLLLLVLLASAVFFYFRPIPPGAFLAMGQTWNPSMGSARDPQSAPQANPDDLNRMGPQQPSAPGRPAAWPANRVAGERGPAAGDGRREPVAADLGIPCEGAEILARVGNDVILACEVSMNVAELRTANKDALPSVLEKGIREYMKKQVEPRIVEKLVCQDAQRKIPKEHFGKILDSFGTAFEKKILPDLMEKNKVGSRRELEQRLRAMGITLELFKRAFIERALADEWLKSEIKPNLEISYDQIEAYYREHAADYELHGPQAQWEQLMARKASFPSSEAAYATLAEMGNQVLGGAAFAQVAKARSQGTTADKGGLQDWTSQHSLASKVLDEAIFTLPIGRLSPILEDEQGFHIVRVIERQPTAMMPFAEAQVDIRKKIKAQRRVEAKATYLAKLREQTVIWTAFDKDRDQTAAGLGGAFR